MQWLYKIFVIFILIYCFVFKLTNGFFIDAFYRYGTIFRENDQCRNSTGGTQYAIIVHGWRENCEVEWVKDLQENLKKYRTGCIICMDYGLVAKIPHYFMLAKHVHKIAFLLKIKLEELELRGFNPDEAYIFGFSLGARIALEAGRMYGKRRIAEIDTCDMAGPGFDFFGFRPVPNSKEAAKNVQCIHTSGDKGTITRDCHQNWEMGQCGRMQEAAGTSIGSHGLCPEFYNAAFENYFFAERNPKQCKKEQYIKRFWPKHYRMGYMEPRKSNVRGTFYASTSKTAPFTKYTKKYLKKRRYHIPQRKKFIAQRTQFFEIFNPAQELLAFIVFIGNHAFIYPA